MRKIKIKEMLSCLIAIMLLLFVVINTSIATDVGELTNTNKNKINIENIENKDNINTNANTNTNTNTNINTNTNTNTNININTNKNNSNAANTNKLADTGIESTSVFLIIVFAISSIYAYKKIREYNV